MAVNGAFTQAMALAKMPSMAGTLRDMEIPADVTEALRVFAREEDAIVRAVDLAGISRQHLLPCVDAYVRIVLIYEKAEPLRVLGVRNGDDIKGLQLHRKLLLQRLHPDKSKDVDDIVFAKRVLEAWSIVSGKSLPESRVEKKRPIFRQRRVRWIRMPIDPPGLMQFLRRFRRQSQ